MRKLRLLLCAAAGGGRWGTSLIDTSLQDGLRFALLPESTARTAIGTARRGSLVDYDAFDLAKFAIQESLKRSGIPVDEVDDIVLGEVLQGGGDIARYVAAGTITMSST